MKIYKNEEKSGARKLTLNILKLIAFALFIVCFYQACKITSV